MPIEDPPLPTLLDELVVVGVEEPLEELPGGGLLVAPEPLPGLPDWLGVAVLLALAPTPVAAPGWSPALLVVAGPPCDEQAHGAKPAVTKKMRDKKRVIVASPGAAETV